MLVVVDDRNNTWIQHSFASLLSLQLPFLVIPSRSFVTGHKHALHRLTHCKGNEDNTDWLSHEGIKPTSVFNKMRPEDIATVHTRNEMLDQEVVSPV